MRGRWDQQLVELPVVPGKNEHRFVHWVGWSAHRENLTASHGRVDKPIHPAGLASHMMFGIRHCKGSGRNSHEDKL